MKKTAIILGFCLCLLLAVSANNAGQEMIYQENTEMLPLMETVTVSDTGTAGEKVTLTVYPEDCCYKDGGPDAEDLVYFNQTECDETGNFSFALSLDFSIPYYTACVKVSGEETMRTYILEQENNWYSESFDSYTGGTPDGWKRIGGTNSYLTKAEDTAALCITPSEKEGVVARYFDEVKKDGAVYISYDFRLQNNDGLLGVRFLTEDFQGYNSENEQNLDEAIYVNSENAIYAYLGTRGWIHRQNLGTYTDDTWQKVEMWVDFDNNRITYYLDETEALITSIPDKNYKGLCWAFEKSSGNCCIDNVVIGDVDNGTIDNLVKSGKKVPEYLTADVMVKATAKDKRLGNTFFDDEPAAMTAILTNTTFSVVKTPITISVKNSKGNIVWEKTDTVSLKPNRDTIYEFVPDTSEYGNYSAQVTAGDAVATILYARSVRNTELNPDVGINVHYQQQTWGDANVGMELIKNAGFGITRSTLEYKGDAPYGENTEHGKYIKLSADYGMEILGKVDDLGIYRTDKGVVTSPEGLKATEDYYCWLTETYKNEIKYIEVKNECDLVIMGDNPTYSCADYAAVLKAVYKGAKRGNPDVKVMAFAAAIIREDFFDLMFEEEMFDPETGKPYFDAISVHPYHTQAAPEKTQSSHGSGTAAYQSWYKYILTLPEILEKYGIGDIECWITEMGWGSSPESGEEQAAYYVRSLMLNDIYGVFDKVLFYNFQDNAVSQDFDSYYNFGLIDCWYEMENAYAAKPAYLALSNYNKLMQGFKLKSHKVNSGLASLLNPVYQCTYEKDNIRRVAVWAVNSEAEAAVDIGNAPEYTVYDMYGNKKTYTANGSTVTLNAGTNPIYLEYEIFSAGIYAGERLADSLKGENQTLTAKVKSSDLDISVVPFVAKYADNKLIEAKGLTLNNGIAEWSFADDGSYDNVKVFVFDKFGGLKPMIPAISIEEEQK